MTINVKTYCLLLAFLYSSYVLAGNLYKWVDENGNIHYGDERPTENSHQVEEVELQPLNSFDNPLPTRIETPNTKELKVINEFTSKALKKTIAKHYPTDCFGPSPLANDTPLNREKITKAQHKSLSLLIREMSGSWYGNALYFNCKGQIKDPVIEKIHYSASAEIRLKRSKDLIINFEMYSSKKRVTTHEDIELFLSEEHIAFSDYQSDETVLLNESTHHIELWVENFPTAGVRNELVRIFEIQNKKFTIKQFQYVNGALASVMQWNLVK